MVDRRIADIHNNKQAKKGYKYYSSDGKVYIGLETGRLQLTDQTVDVSNVNFSSCIPQIRVETLVPCNGTINVDGNFGVNGDIQANNFIGNGQTILNVSTYNVLSYSQLQNLVNTNALQATSYYLISDFRTTFKVLGTGTPTDLQGPVETILVMATSLNTLSPVAYSPSRPNDILHYSLNDVTQLAPNDLSISKGVITYREDTSKDLSAYYDWRTVTFRRWESSPGSLFYAWPVPYPGTGGYYDFYTFTDPNGGNNQYCHIGYYTINVAMIGDYNFGITIAERCGGIGSGITIQDFNTEIKIDQNCATVASSGSFAPPGIYIGTNNIYVNIGKRTYSVYIDNACYALELGVQQNNIAIPSNTWRKRIEKGFSNFECTLDITGLTTIDLVNNSISIAGGNLASPVAYCGILNLVSSNANETINKIEGLPNSTAFAPYRLKPESGLSLTIVDKTVAGGTANMILNVNNITVDGTRSEYAVFNRYMLTLGNVTSDFVLETTNIRELFSVYVDGVTITGDGTTGNPLISATSGIKTALPFTTDHISATGNQYLIGDVVYYSGNVYRCIANNDSIIPTSTLYWTNLGAGYPLVQQPVDWSSTSGNNQVLNKPTIVSSVTDDGNGVVTVDNTIPTAPVIQFQGVNVDGLTITGDGTSGNPLQSPYNPPTDGYYGAFSDFTDQFAIAPNTGYVITLDTTDLTNGVTVVSNSRITFSATGIYNIQFSAQFVNTEVIEHDVTVWLRKNGVDVPGSAGFVAVVQKHGVFDGHSVPAWNYLVDALAGDYYEFVWSTTDIDVYLATFAAAAPAPSIPSMIVTATQQSGIIAGTGITALNTLTASVQTMVTGTTGTDFNISSATSTHTFNLPTASATNRGALSSADWTTFNGKLSAAITTLGGQTGSTQSLATGTIGTDFNILSTLNTHTFNLPTASATNRGLLSTSDWTTFNSKQPAGSYITALTGDVTASGPGSAAATIANGSVTYVKMQVASTTSKLIGSSASSTTLQEITLGTGLSMSGSTLNASSAGPTVNQVMAYIAAY